MIDTTRLPPAEKSQLKIGYLRLTDSAPLIMAKELGFYEKYGLSVQLQREVSWANVRDKLVVGELDAAQLLAPLPLATALGAGGLRAEIITGLALSLNGNAITLGQSLAAELGARRYDVSHNAPHDAASAAKVLGDYLGVNRRGLNDDGAVRRRITLAAAHTFSCHILQLRHWLRTGGIDPQRDVQIIVLPPEQMVDSLARGIIDGFCVGEPWNSVAVQYGVGSVQATGYHIWKNALEKVLGVTEAWHQRHAGSHLRLRLALMEACSWLAQPYHREQAAEVLAQPRYLDLPPERLRPALTGRFAFAKDGPVVDLPDFHVFGRHQAGFPWRSDGEWLLRGVGELLGKTFSAEDSKTRVQRSFRTDLYREAARLLDLPCPAQDYRAAGEECASASGA